MKSKPKKLKPFEFQLKEDIFGSALYVIVNKPYDRMVADIKKKFPDFQLDNSAREGALGLTFEYYDDKINRGFPFIWIAKFEWSIVDQGTLAHETAHFIFRLLESKGIKLDTKEPNEPYCYLFEYYFVNALRQLGKQYS